MNVDPVFESVGTFTPAQFRVWVEDREARGDINHYELLHGRIVMNPPAGWPHGRVEARLVTQLSNFTGPARLGEVLGSSQGFELPSGDVVEPDVSFVSASRLASANPREREFAAVVPELVAEIASPSTASRDRGEKFGIYEKNGVLEYWQLDSHARRVRVFVAREGRFHPDQLVEGDGTVTSRVLPGFSVTLADLFA